MIANDLPSWKPDWTSKGTASSPKIVLNKKQPDTPLETVLRQTRSGASIRSLNYTWGLEYFRTYLDRILPPALKIFNRRKPMLQVWGFKYGLLKSVAKDSYGTWKKISIC